MNWKNIKNFMLILLVAVNIFLAAMLIRQMTLKTYGNDTVRDARELLSQSVITADKKFITLSPREADLYICKTADDYAVDVAKRLMTEQYDAFATPGGVSFLGENESLSIENGFDIRYASKNFILPTDGTSKINEKELDNIKKSLTDILIGDSDDKYSFRVDEAEAIGKTNRITVTQTIDGLTVENHSLECYFEDDKLVCMSGKWSFLPTNEKKSAHLLDCVNILFIEKNELDAKRTLITGDSAQESEDSSLPLSMTLKNANVCYLSFFSEEDSALYFIPSWHLTWEEDGVNDTYYNALNGNKIK